MRAVLADMDARGFAEDVEAFQRARADAADDGGWGDAFPYSRGTVRVSLEQLEAFFEEYLALLAKYSEGGTDTRTVNTLFLAYPDASGDREAGASS
ncbi:hypothetical protein ACQPZF_28730 [Actinosynnema sp. CS-041913]|uniref:hypothetical protein n=1 Tax=Actinosynnema sp. CS-041913 TaxID=3239917 RepID=UPI003D920F4C